MLLRQRFLYIGLLARLRRCIIHGELVRFLHAFDRGKSLLPLMEFGVLIFDRLFKCRRHEGHCSDGVPRDEHEVCEAKFLSHEIWTAGAGEVVVDDADDAFDFGLVAGLSGWKFFFV